MILGMVNQRVILVIIFVHVCGWHIFILQPFAPLRYEDRCSCSGSGTSVTCSETMETSVLDIPTNRIFMIIPARSGTTSEFWTRMPYQGWYSTFDSC